MDIAKFRRCALRNNYVIPVKANSDRLPALRVGLLKLAWFAYKNNVSAVFNNYHSGCFATISVDRNYLSSLKLGVHSCILKLLGLYRND
jgi:hypothetical protein